MLLPFWKQRKEFIDTEASETVKPKEMQEIY